MAIIDNAVYVDGRRIANPESLDITYDVMQERHGMSWIGLYRPDRAEIDAVAAEFDLHHLAVDDAIAAHQRPKLEGYGDQLFTGQSEVARRIYDLSREVMEFQRATVPLVSMIEALRAMTQVSIEQNEQVKRISSWGAILFAPTLIAGIYGMNFEAMPELAWAGGYPMAVVLMVAASVALYVVFRRQKWL